MRGWVSAVLSDFWNHSESGTDSTIGTQMHSDSRLKVLAPPSHTTDLPCFQIRMPPRMAMMNIGSSDERPNGSSSRKDQARMAGVQVLGRNKDFMDQASAFGCPCIRQGWIVPHRLPVRL